MQQTDLAHKRLSYRSLGLEENPFPYLGIPENQPKVFHSQQDIAEALRLAVGNPMSIGHSACVAIIGSYGSGKSHTLRYSKATWVSGEATRESVCTAYIAQPGILPIQIYGETAQDLGWDFFAEMARKYLGKSILELGKQGKTHKESIPEDPWHAVETGAILLSEVFPYAVAAHSRITRYPDFSRAFLSTAIEEHSLSGWEWLTQQGLDPHTRKVLGIHQNLSDKKGTLAFQALKATLHDLGMFRLILLVDEFEHIETYPLNIRQRSLNTFRHLIDLNPKGLSLVIACTPEVWADIISEYHAFAERIFASVFLRPVNVKEMNRIVTSYLDTGRIEKGRGTVPFNRKVINRIARISGGNMRRIITLCSQTLRYAAERGLSEVDESCLPERSSD